MTIWMRYSKKVVERIEKPRYAGFFLKEEAEAKNMRLAIGQEGSIEQGSLVALYWLVDTEDGVIADAKFQVFGPSSLIAAADSACEMVIRKNYEQVRRISADMLDQPLRDKSDTPAFPDEVAASLNFVLFAIENASETCMDIPIEDGYVHSPVSATSAIETQEYPGWLSLSKEEKIRVLEEVIAREIRPYIELDQGGIKILDLRQGYELIIAYEGSCTSCYSATGATLQAIEQILKAKVHPSLIVIPDLSFLKKEHS